MPDAPVHAALAAEARHVGPEQSASEQHERGRQHEEGEEHRDHDTGRTGDAEGTVALQLGEDEGEQGERDGAAARDDRGAGAAEGAGHGVATILVQAQLVPIAGDQQQGIVGAGAEDEHRQDARYRGIQGDASERGDPGRGDAREAVGGSHDDQRHQPEPRAAVGDEQQNRNDDHCRQQQREISTLEDGGNVDGEALGTGEQSGQPARKVCVGGGAKLLGAVGLRRNILDDLQRHDDQGCSAVVGDRGRRHEVVLREPRQVGCRCGDRLDVGIGQLRAVATEDEKGAGRIRARQVFLGRGDSCRLGGRWQTDAR